MLPAPRDREEIHMQTQTETHDERGVDRVRDHTSGPVNERIDRLTEARLEEYRDAPPEEIGRRIAELDREWDADRALMLNFSLLGGLTSALAMRQVHKRRGRFDRNPFLYLFGAQLSFLALHATVGWCPPVPLFRRLGFRTSKEIQRERSALEAMLRERSTTDGSMVASEIGGPTV
jgi:hypothetical protein